MYSPVHESAAEAINRFAISISVDDGPFTNSLRALQAAVETLTRFIQRRPPAHYNPLPRFGLRASEGAGRV